MKFMGGAAVGAGAAGLTAPVFHDLDELLSAPAGVQKGLGMSRRETSTILPST